jgi:hypothetical protein
VEGAGRRVDENDPFARKGLARDQPVEGVLEGAREAVRVFGRGNDDGVAGADKCAKSLHRLGLRFALDVVVGAEWREPCEIAVDQDADVRRRKLRQRLERGCVDRPAAQAARDREHPDFMHVNSGRR